MTIKIRIWILVLFISSLTQAGNVIDQAPFKATGYREKTIQSGLKFSVEAPLAKGIGKIGFTTLYHPQIQIDTPSGTIKISGDEGLFKISEIIIRGQAIFELIDNKSKAKILKFSSQKPEDRLLFSVSDAQLLSPGGLLEFKGKTFKGRALAIDLQKGEFNWVQKVEDEKGNALKVPYSQSF